ncbi:C-X-C motif chemokine 19 [Menidia menidia]
MTLRILLLIATLHALAEGMPPLNRDYTSHCGCLQLESRIIPPASLRSLRLLPHGPHCAQTEVIASLASGEKVCLNPRSAWVKKLVRFVMDRQLHPQGTAPKIKA